MGLIDFFSGKPATITSSMIRDEIFRAETEITEHNAQIGTALAGLGTMSDGQHVSVEADIATHRRVIARLEARVAHLSAELPAVRAAEEAAEKAEADAVLRLRAEAARKANSKDAAKLLSDYDKLASQIGDIIERMEAISDEREAVNAALRANPVAATVTSFTELHRRYPDRQASERRETRPVWVTRDSSGETVREATLDAEGKPIPQVRSIDQAGYPVAPQLESREIVVARTDFRPGRFLDGLEGVILPPGLAGGQYHWPRR